MKKGAMHRDQFWLYSGKKSIADTNGFPSPMGPHDCWCEKPRSRTYITAYIKMFISGLICKRQHVKVCCYIWWMKTQQQTFGINGHLQVRNNFCLGPPWRYTLLRVCAPPELENPFQLANDFLRFNNSGWNFCSGCLLQDDYSLLPLNSGKS